MEFALEIEIKRPSKRVFEFLLDLRNYVSLHPLIESIVELPLSSTTPSVRRYEVVDRIAIGPFSFRSKYRAALEPIHAHEVRGQAWQSPGIEVVTVYRLESIACGTHLHEAVSIKAPWFLRAFVTRQARAAHQQTLSKLKQWLEGERDNEGGAA